MHVIYHKETENQIKKQEDTTNEAHYYIVFPPKRRCVCYIIDSGIANEETKQED